MSDNIPLDIQVDIIKRLPVKSLIQFRSVSKAWKSRIDSSDFITRYDAQHTQPQHVLVNYKDVDLRQQKYVSILDDDTFPRNKVYVTVSLLAIMLKYSSIIGSSRGLFCLYGNYRKGHEGPVSATGRAVIWNPSIRKSVDVIVPNVACWKRYNRVYETTLGFGVCRETNDPKIVKITHIYRAMDIINDVPWQVEVFSLSGRVWRRPRSNVPRTSIRFGDFKVFKDGFLYWLGRDTVIRNGGLSEYYLIISFDMTSEEFKEVKLPDSLAYYQCLTMCKLRESVVVVKLELERTRVFGVWRMDDGVPNSFTKILSINAEGSSLSIMAFRKTGKPIFNMIRELGIIRTRPEFSIHPYTETLLLLDHPDFVIYNKAKRYIAKWKARNRRLLKHSSNV